MGSETDKVYASEAVKKIHKKFGAPILRKASEFDHGPTHYWTTGIFSLDYALGGGFPAGKSSVVWGPKSSAKTTTFLLTIARAQKSCAVCYQHESRCTCKKIQRPVAAFFDVEGGLDLPWAERLGVNLDDMFLSQPAYAEQTLDIAEGVILNGCDIVVIDSIAFLSPEKEIAGSVSAEMMGVQARALGKGIRKFVSALNSIRNKTGRAPTVLFTNQIRMKLGVVFGCFPYQAPVLLADGSRRSIGSIVNQKQPVEVLSWNSETRLFEPRRVVRWWKQGEDVDRFRLSDEEVGDIRQEFRTLVVSYPDGSGHTQVTATPNHLLATPTGFRPVQDLDLNDDILCRHERVVLSADLGQLLLGSMHGDGSIRQSGEYTSYYRESHAQKEREYLLWKRSCFGDLVRAGGVDTEGSRSEVGFETTAMSALQPFRSLFYAQSKRFKKVSSATLEKLNPFGLAVWYQDDGWLADENGNRQRNVICLHEMSEDERHNLRRFFEQQFGLHPAVCSGGHRTDVQFNGEEAVLFEDLVRPYVHPSMVDRKLRKSEGAGSLLPELEFGWSTEFVPYPCRIREIRRSIREGSQGVRYNLEVEGNATYVVGDAIVHNSPETQPGGQAPGYMAATETRMSTGKYEMDEVLCRPACVTFPFRVDKNKTHVPKVEGEFKLQLTDSETRKMGEVLNDEALVDIAVRMGLIEGGGQKWTLFGEVFKSKSLINRELIVNQEFHERVWRALMAMSR